jgi:hypothetical protein
VELPYPLGTVVYPAIGATTYFGCNDVEIRQNGVELQRIPFIDRGTHVGAVNPCGHDTVAPGYSVAHAGRLPLHLKYRFEKPGFYQLRYTRIMHPQGSVQSDWTTIDVQPAQFEALPSAPADPYEIMSDFLPNLLAVRDMETRTIIEGYLEHPNEEVRRYATASLDYWP